MNTIQIPAKTVPVYARTDVLVAGGGPAGIAAALAAARNGASVLLVEQRGYLGGMATVSQVPAFCPYSDHKKLVIRGIGLEILEEMKRRMEPEFLQLWQDKTDWVPIDAEVLKKLLDDKLKEAGVKLLYHTFAGDALSANGFVETVLIHNKTGTQAVQARMIIDATSDADIVYRAGGKFNKGGETGDLQPGTMCFVLSRLNRQRYAEYVKEHGPSLKKAINRAKAQGELRVVRDWAGISWVNDSTAGLNFGHVFGIDGANAEDLTRGAIEGRELVHHIVGWLAKTIPGFEQAYLVQTGDQIGIRETRRIVGDYVLTADDFRQCRTFHDDIARNAYFIDIHMAHEAGGMTVVHLPPGASHGIPYRSLLPLDIHNVLVAGRAISTDRITQGSTRVMPNCFAMGEAAGTAAALLIKQGLSSTREVNMEILQKQLIGQGAWLGEALQARYGAAAL